MRFFHYFTLLVALTISVCAAYYSIIGLTAIFAASVIPVIIMGSVLELAKITGAIWLKLFWHQAAWWLKFYLVPAVAILMLITSIGIFGFLSRAHIEQTANAQAGIAQIERIESEIDRQRLIVEQASAKINSAQSQGSDKDQEIQAQIDIEQSRIDTVYDRIQPAIDEQNTIINSEQQKTQQAVGLLRSDIQDIDQDLELLKSALADNDVKTAQSIVGVSQDGALGPTTRSAIADFRSSQQLNKQQLVRQLEAISEQPQPEIDDARAEIQRLRLSAEQQIANSNELINRLRQQLGTTDTDAVEQAVNTQQQRIATADSEIEQLLEQKYQLEIEARKLEAEVGPIKFVAELIYGDTNVDLLEQSVRWMILLLVAVFDPLAVILTLAAITGLATTAKTKKQQPKITELLSPDNIEYEDTPLEQYTQYLSEQIQELIAEKDHLEQQLETADHVNRDQVFDLEQQIAQLKNEISFNAQQMQESVDQPAEVIAAPADNDIDIELMDVGTASFGTTWPRNPAKNDLFLKTDSNPTVLYRWNGRKWQEENKGNIDESLTYDFDFVKWLTGEVKKGKTEFSQLSALQQNQVKAYILKYGQQQ